eukprot:3602250-Amphidinium_carterae.2
MAPARTTQYGPLHILHMEGREQPGIEANAPLMMRASNIVTLFQDSIISSRDLHATRALFSFETVALPSYTVVRPRKPLIVLCMAHPESHGQPHVCHS